jgi:hypothetical protein
MVSAFTERFKRLRHLISPPIYSEKRHPKPLIRNALRSLAALPVSVIHLQAL